MLATLGEVPAGPGWAFEWKWDGQRASAVVQDSQCHLYSRNDNDVTNSFPELAEALAGALNGREGVVDGEVVALDEGGRPSFRPAATPDARAAAHRAAPRLGTGVVLRV